ncbi:MAG: DNA repair protein RecO [Cyanobacteria bacterium CRU_2_1]|nr:DNA repair protein RecO [Cyanobacteria bacterium RU_5_0]NJR58821.1 DNA repair protein RecO [Cyanobacteria bacterium CRU_2_1]
MSGTYKAIGINLKSTPLGETDRLLTILTEEHGLLRVVAPGCRKHKSSLGGRSSLFVVNELLIAKGRNLDKIIQAESVESYPGLSQDLRKLTASQYLAELTLYQALSDQPQTELFCLLREHLSRLEKLPEATILASLIHAMFHLLTIAGLAPQVQLCCVSQQPLDPNWTDPNWRIGFSIVAGGTVKLSALEQLATESLMLRAKSVNRSVSSGQSQTPSSPPSDLCVHLDAMQLSFLQQLAKPNLVQDLIQTEGGLRAGDFRVWLSIERILRHYAQYHFDRPIRSATLIDTCFLSANAPSLV